MDLSCLHGKNPLTDGTMENICQKLWHNSIKVFIEWKRSMKSDVDTEKNNFHAGVEADSTVLNMECFHLKIAFFYQSLQTYLV